jgi:hypothetical protein
MPRIREILVSILRPKLGDSKFFMKSSIFWDITPCSALKDSRRFGETYLIFGFPLPGGFLLGLLLNPEDGGDIFLQNVGCLSTDYTALYPKRQNSS